MKLITILSIVALVLEVKGQYIDDDYGEDYFEFLRNNSSDDETFTTSASTTTAPRPVTSSESPRPEASSESPWPEASIIHHSTTTATILVNTTTSQDEVSTTPQSATPSPFTTEDHQYFVLITYDDRQVGVGSLLSNKWVVSAASSTVGKSVSRLKVRASFTTSENGQLRHVESKHEHPEFDRDNDNFNIVLLLLHAPVTSYRFKRIPYASERPANGSELTTAILEQSYMCQYSEDYCTGDLVDSIKSFPLVVNLDGCRHDDTRTGLCVIKGDGDVDNQYLCQSRMKGSPLILNGVLYGLFSSPDYYYCSSSTTQLIYTDVSKVKRFIKTITKIPAGSTRGYNL